MKTLQIGLNWFPEQPGGLDRFYYDCARSLSSVGVGFDGLVVGSENVATNSAQQVEAFAPSSVSLWRRWFGIRHAMSSKLSGQNYDLVVSHFALYTFPVLDQIKPYPLVMHFHGPWALESQLEGGRSLNTWLKRGIEKICYAQVDRFIVLSETFRQLLHDEYQVPLDKICVIPAGITIEDFQVDLSPLEARRKLSWEFDRPTIVVVRRLAKRMGLENLLDAIDTVRHKYPKVSLKIAGKGPLRSALKQQIQAKNLAKNVELLGFVPDADLPFVYRAADFSVVPTLALEGFGLVVIESLAAGTPVLGTPICAIPEILRPLSPDLVFDGVEPEHIAQKLMAVLDGNCILPDTHKCQAYVQENYSWSDNLSQIKAVYQAAIDAHLSGCRLIG